MFAAPGTLFLACGARFAAKFAALAVGALEGALFHAGLASQTTGCFTLVSTDQGQAAFLLAAGVNAPLEAFSTISCAFMLAGQKGSARFLAVHEEIVVVGFDIYEFNKGSNIER